MNLQANVFKQPYSLQEIDEQINNDPDMLMHINCFSHALGLTQKDIIAACKNFLTDLYNKEKRNLIDSVFVDNLIKEGILQEIYDQYKPKNSDIVIYYKDKKIEHAGIVISYNHNMLIVKSKLGCGMVCLHQLHEVTKSYGSKVKYYKPLSNSKIQQIKAKLNLQPIYF